MGDTYKLKAWCVKTKQNKTFPTVHQNVLHYTHTREQDHTINEACTFILFFYPTKIKPNGG